MKRMGSGASKLSPAVLENVDIVIIGGGYGGLQLAHEFKKRGIRFTLVEPKEYFHHCVGALRAAVNVEYVKQTAIPLKEAFGDNYVQGRAVKIDVDEKKVVLESGQELCFSHCIICVGSLGPSPARSSALTREDLEEEAAQFSEAVTKAEEIVVVGGGPVGVELAGEIIDKHPDKKITLVSASEKLVSPNFDDKFQSSMKSTIERRKVKVRVTQ